MIIKNDRVTGGFAQEFVDRLTEKGGTYGHRYCPFHNSVTTINPWYARIVAFEIMQECGVQLLLHCEVTSVSMGTEGHIDSVIVTGKGQQIEIFAQQYIDATGDGDVAYIAGAEYKKGQEETGILQPPSLLFDMGGICFEKFFDYLEAHPEELPYNSNLDHIRSGYDAAFFRESPNHVFFGLNAMVKKLRAEGKCPVDRDTVIYIRQPYADHVCINTIRILGFDGSDVYDLSRGEVEAHLTVLPLIQMFKEHVPGFENCYLSSINPTIGVRESRRIVGKKMLMKESVIAAEVPNDSIALGSYIIDIHSGEGEETYIKTLEDPYGIPYLCTVSSSIDNLMMSGRCISVDATVFGSIRVMPTLMAIGQGVGVGAALAVKGKIAPADVDVSLVREILVRNMAILSVT